MKLKTLLATLPAFGLIIVSYAQSAVPLEATAEDKFQIKGAVAIEFDAAVNRMTIKRRGGERVFMKEK